MRFLLSGFFLLGSLFSVAAQAHETLTLEPDENSYSFVSQYRKAINVAPEKVWPHLVDLKSWMYEFDLSHHSGEPKKVGQVLRLYPKQDFFIQLTSMIPNNTLVMANLPSTFQGEYSTGIGVITLTEIQGKTLVNLVMSRRYTWRGEGDNTMRGTRESAEFMQRTRATWSKFLDRLQLLAEGGLATPPKKL